MHKAIRFSRRVPGQLTVMLMVLVLVCLATGLGAALDVQRRQDVLDGVIDRGGPLTGAAVEIYQSLSDANATAASAFLFSGVDPDNLRKRYDSNITEASAALSTAAAGSPTGESAATVTQLAAYLPVYTGLVERARAYNRQGQPQGAAYLREASHLVQSMMLPSAQQLYRAEATRLAQAQVDAGVLGWVFLSLGVLTLGGLVAVQVHLARSTRRVLNAGLLAATLAAVAAMSWYGIAAASAADHSVASHQAGSAAVEAFAEARIKALEARSDEALTLVARGNGRTYEEHFAGVRDELNNGILARAKAAASTETAAHVENAIGAWYGWLESHTKLREQDDIGSYDKAVELATNGAPGELSTKVDEELGVAIARATETFRREAANARDAVSGADIGVGVLMVLASLGVWGGLTPRIREYR
nr:secreted protein [Kibdelosporangium sp. MJ126-NF4]